MELTIEDILDNISAESRAQFESAFSRQIISKIQFVKLMNKTFKINNNSNSNKIKIETAKMLYVIKFIDDLELKKKARKTSGNDQSNQ